MRVRRRGRRIACVAALGVAVAFGAAVPSASAQRKPAAHQAPPPSGPDAVASRLLLPDAQVAFADGRKLFKNRDYAGADVKFERAYELSRNPAVLLYIAECAKNVGDYSRQVDALSALQDVPRVTALEAGAAQDDLDDIPEILGTLMRFVDKLHLSVNESGAEVFVGEKQVGTTPLPQPLLLNLGDRKIRVTKQGFKDAEQTVHVKGGAVEPLSMTLKRIVHEGRLIVDAEPDALVQLDNRPMDFGHWEGPVASGRHTLRVTASGKLPHEREVIIADDKWQEVHVTLPPAPNRDWPKLIVVGVGAVAVGFITGAVLLTRSSGGGPVPPGMVSSGPLSWPIHR
jgi:hypothetical protein